MPGNFVVVSLELKGAAAGSERDSSKPSGPRHYLRALGPGLVTGASDDDPSGIATYAQAGAQFKYTMLWSALLTLPLMAGVQEICDRTALATGESLGQLCRKRFGRFGRGVLTVLLVALLAANLLNIAADLLAVGAGMNLLHAGPVSVWALIAGVLISVGIIAGSFDTISRIFKYLCLSLLTYLIVLFFAHVDWGSVVGHTLVPHMQWSGAYLALLVGVLGTTISPYLFFWQTAHRVEEQAKESGDSHPVPLKQRPRSAARRAERESRFDVFVGMGLSNAVMFAIIVATAATIGQSGEATINSAADAAKALRPIAGRMSEVLFAVGFIGTGILAVPVLAAAASVGLAGLYDKPWGYSQPVHKAPLFYILGAVGALGGTALSLVGVDPIRLLIVVAVVNGVATTPFLITVMLISSNERLMGEYRNGHLATTVGWLTVAVMLAGTTAILVTAVH